MGMNNAQQRSAEAGKIVLDMGLDTQFHCAVCMKKDPNPQILNCTMVQAHFDHGQCKRFFNWGHEKTMDFLKKLVAEDPHDLYVNLCSFRCKDWIAVKAHLGN